LPPAAGLFGCLFKQTNGKPGKKPLSAAKTLRLIVHSSRPILPGMAKKPEPPQPTTWSIYKIAAKQVWLGTVEAVDEAEAIEKAAAEFKVIANKLIAVRRR
jgi:hypothetical protein